MALLLTSDANRAALAALRKHAEYNPISLEERSRRIAARRAVGDDPEFSCAIATGFLVVYSIEATPQSGLMRHLSVSLVDGRRRDVPPPLAIDWIAAELGFLRPGKPAFKSVDGSRHPRVDVLEYVSAVELPVSP